MECAFASMDATPRRAPPRALLSDNTRRTLPPEVPVASSPFVANLVEFFTLKDAARRIDSVADTARDGVRTGLLLSRQKAVCAETLWANGHAAEGLSLATGALRSAERATNSLRAADADEDPAEWERVLSERGLSKTDLEFVRGTLTQTADAHPLLDRDVSPAHADLFHASLRARSLLDRKLQPATMTHRDVRFARIVRTVLSAVGGVALLGGAYFLLRTPSGTFASASDYFQQSPQYAPENIIDGTTDTFWLLPDRASGWVEASVSPPRHVGSVRVTNTSNPPWGDRGTQAYRVEAYSHGSVVQTAEGTFASPAAAPNDHVIDANDIDRVRVVVVSHHGHGGGLAELELR